MANILFQFVLILMINFNFDKILITKTSNKYEKKDWNLLYSKQIK